MYWIAATSFLLLLGIDVIDWRRFRQLLPAAMTGVILAGIHIGMPEVMRGVSLNDTGPLVTTTAITLLLQSLGGPIIATWFAQGTAPGRLPVLRVLLFTGISLCVEWQARAAGRLVYAHWWNAGWSALYYSGSYLLIWKVQTYCLAGRANAGQAAEKPHPH